MKYASHSVVRTERAALRAALTEVVARVPCASSFVAASSVGGYTRSRRPRAMLWELTSAPCPTGDRSIANCGLAVHNWQLPPTEGIRLRLRRRRRKRTHSVDPCRPTVRTPTGSCREAQGSEEPWDIVANNDSDPVGVASREPDGTLQGPLSSAAANPGSARPWAVRRNAVGVGARRTTHQPHAVPGISPHWVH